MPVSSSKIYLPRRVQTSRVSYTKVVKAMRPKEMPRAGLKPSRERNLPMPEA